MIGAMTLLYISTFPLFLVERKGGSSKPAAAIAASLLALIGAAAEVGARYLWAVIYAA